MKLETYLNRTQKVRCSRTIQIPSLITVLFRERAGVFNRKIISKYTKWATVKLFNTETGAHFDLSYENLGVRL